MRNSVGVALIGICSLLVAGCAEEDVIPLEVQMKSAELSDPTGLSIFPFLLSLFGD